jgi:AraC-like DNA-binding protein
MKDFLLGGVIQALLLALYFIFNKFNKNIIAQRWLGILLLLVATTMGLNYFLSENYKQFPHLIRIWELLPFLYPPTIFLYIYALLYGNIYYSKKYFFLLIPFFIGIIILFPFLTSSSSLKIQQYELAKNTIPENFYLLFWLKSLYGLTMILASFHIIFKYKKNIKLVFADNAINKWAISSLIAFSLLWIVGIGRVLFDFNEIITKMVSIILIISIYILTYFTLKQTQIFGESDLIILEEIKINKPELFLIEKEEAKSIYSNLSNIVKNEKLFLDKNFNLQKLTQICKCKSTVVSDVLNNHNNQNFYAFINEFRVNEVCKMLKSDENSHLTLDGLGELCGFKSKSTFYQSFKEVTGKTPMQYKKEHKK